MSTLIKIPYEKLDQEDAAYDALLASLATQASIVGAESYLENDDVVFVIKNVSKIKLSHCQIVDSAGGEVEGLPLFIQVSGMSDLTPVGLKNSVKYEGEITPVPVGQKTWQEWSKPNQIASQGTDNNWYVSTAANSGEYLSYSELSLVSSQLVTVTEYKAVMPVSEI